MSRIDPVKRLQRMLNAIDEKTFSSIMLDEVADLRALLAEVRNLRARVLDPANTWLVTVKLPKNPAHDPRAKRTGQCPFSNECTDVTGEHHSFLTGAEGLEELRAGGTHITRTERLQRSPDFLRP